MATDDVISLRRGWAGSLEATTQSDQRTSPAMAEAITRRLVLLQRQVDRLILVQEAYGEAVDYYGLHSRQAQQIKREKLDVVKHLLAFHTIHLEDEMHRYVAYQGDTSLRFHTRNQRLELGFAALHEVITHGTKAELIAFLRGDISSKDALVESVNTLLIDNFRAKALSIIQKLQGLQHMRCRLSDTSSEQHWVEYLLQSRNVRRSMDAYIDNMYEEKIAEASLVMFEQELRVQGWGVPEASFNRVYLALVAEEDSKLTELNIQLVEPALNRSSYSGISATEMHFFTRSLSP